MKKVVLALMTLSLSGAMALAQVPQSPAQDSQHPFFQVLVVGRTIQAVNYENRTDPTRIDFKGTVILDTGKGKADIIAKRGVTEIDAKFEGLTPPTRFGPGYLTYVLWAISPDGRAVNLGEIIPDTSNNAHVQVSTHLQAFGLLVTAEPYYSVAQPSDVVVLENMVRPDTLGRIEVVNAKYDLIQRDHYTFDETAAAAAGTGQKVSMDRYQAILALYEAQNAVQIAVSAGADKYAPDTLAKAKGLLLEAQNYEAGKADSKKIVMTAREAAEVAEDARAISARVSERERLIQTAPEPTAQMR